MKFAISFLPWAKETYGIDLSKVKQHWYWHSVGGKTEQACSISRHPETFSTDVFFDYFVRGFVATRV